MGDTSTSLTVPPSSAGEARPNEPTVSIRKPAAATSMPSPILRGADGSLPFDANALKMARENGVSATTKNGLNCWKSDGWIGTSAGNDV